MDREFDIDRLVGEMDFESNKFNNINYKSCNTLKEIIFQIEDLIQDMDIVEEDLDYISGTISERDYYQNTNK